MDKPLLPFSAVTPRRSPCPAAEPCAPPVAFRHLLPLTNDSAEFRRRVRSQRVSANMDAPEGGFDAIVQVAVCQVGERGGGTALCKGVVGAGGVRVCESGVCKRRCERTGASSRGCVCVCVCVCVCKRGHAESRAV